MRNNFESTLTAWEFYGLKNFEDVKRFCEKHKSNTKETQGATIMREFEKDLREFLQVDAPSFDEFWKARKSEIFEILNAHRQFIGLENFSFCFESDFEREKDLRQDMRERVKVIDNARGIVFFEVIKPRERASV